MKLAGKLPIVLLLLLVAGGGFAAWNEISMKQSALAELETKNTQLTQENESLKKQSATCEESKSQAETELKELKKSNCKGVWSEETGCEEPKQVFSSPTGGETLCFGTTVDVKWNSELIKSETVEVHLATSGNSGKLATLKNSEGVYHWKLEPTYKGVGSGGGSFTIAPGSYKLRLQSEEGALLGKDTEPVSIKKCGGKAPAPVKKKSPARKKGK